jgi:hypothetical protein
MSSAFLQRKSVHRIHRSFLQCCHNAVGSVSIVDNYGNEIYKGKSALTFTPIVGACNHDTHIACNNSVADEISLTYPP